MIPAAGNRPGGRRSDDRYPTAMIEDNGRHVKENLSGHKILGSSGPSSRLARVGAFGSSADPRSNAGVSAVGSRGDRTATHRAARSGTARYGDCLSPAGAKNDRRGVQGDTPSAPRLRWQSWALRPGLDGASRPSTTPRDAVDRRIRGTPDRNRAVSGLQPAVDPIRRFFGGQFGCRQGGT